MFIAATVWGEARGEGREGKIAVAHVILNRVDKGGWWGDNIRDVCQKPKQFSCWNSTDPNHEPVHDIAYNWRAGNVTPIDTPDVQLCVEAALMALLGREEDATMGSTHYAVNGLKPSWYDKEKEVCRIGNHTFYKGIK